MCACVGVVSGAILMRCTLIHVCKRWMILQQDRADDFVIATGETHTVREFVEKSFKCVGITIEWRGEHSSVDEVGYEAGTERALVKIDPKYFRPTEVGAEV